MEVLITGATGLLGPYLVAAARELGTVATSSLSDGDKSCDLTDAEATSCLLRLTNPSVVIHAAAWTDIEGCEKDPNRAFAVNRDSVANLVRALDAKSLLIYISTDQVYPDTRGAHHEGDESPVNTYGWSKLEGEQAALKHPRALVLRTNFFGRSRTQGRQSLSDFVEASLRDESPISLFEDVHFSPLHLQTLADLVVETARRRLAGVFNIGSREGTSKADFAFMVARRLELSTDGVRRGESTDIASRTPRPLDLRLDVSRIEAALGRAMPTLAEEVAKL